LARAAGRGPTHEARVEKLTTLAAKIVMTALPLLAAWLAWLALATSLAVLLRAGQVHGRVDVVAQPNIDLWLKANRSGEADQTDLIVADLRR
jgi:hypothetical protein